MPRSLSCSICTKLYTLGLILSPKAIYFILKSSNLGHSNKKQNSFAIYRTNSACFQNVDTIIHHGAALHTLLQRTRMAAAKIQEGEEKPTLLPIKEEPIHPSNDAMTLHDLQQRKYFALKQKCEHMQQVGASLGWIHSDLLGDNGEYYSIFRPDFTFTFMRFMARVNKT